MKKLIRIHLLPRTKDGKIYDTEDRAINLGDNFDTYADSLKEYVEVTKPSLLLEHNLDGNSYGRVESIENTPEGIFGIASVDNPEDLKGKRFVSPRIRWNHTDINGRRWPAALLETSLVSVPRFQVGQQEIESINSMNYSSVIVEDTKFSEVNLEGLQLPIEEIDQPQEENMLTPEMIEQIKLVVKEAMLEADAAEEALELAKETEEAAAEAPALETEAAEDVTVEAEATLPTGEEVAVEESTMEEPLEVVELEEVEDMEPSTMGYKISRMSAKSKDELLMKLAEALYETKKETVMSAIKADLKARNIDEAKANNFYKLYKSDKEAYESTMSAFGKPVTKVPVTKPTRQSPVVESTMSGVDRNLSPSERALADVKSGKGSFQERLNFHKNQG